MAAREDGPTRLTGLGALRAGVPRVLRRRCPRCGEGALFRTRTLLAEACGACGHRYRREAGSMTGSMYLSAVVTELFAALVLAALWLGTDWSTPVALAVGVPLVGGFALWFLPRSRALWSAVEYATDVGNREPWTRAD